MPGHVHEFQVLRVRDFRLIDVERVKLDLARLLEFTLDLAPAELVITRWHEDHALRDLLDRPEFHLHLAILPGRL